MVMRHPDHNVLENAADMTFYWAHHEKFIVIDYNTAFIGGLDLCFGRWDNHQHPLADVHPAGVATEVWPGQDFNNNRVMDFQSVDNWKSNELSKAEYGRMPWHDVAMGVVGDCVYDIAEHFVLRWNFVKRDKYKRDGRFDWLTLEGREGADEDLIGVQRPKHPVGDYIHHPQTPLSGKTLGEQGTVHAQIVRSSCDWSSGILTEHSIQNAYKELIRNAEHYVYIENQFFITATGDQQAPIKNIIGEAIVEAVVRAGKEGRKFRVIAVIPSIPGFAGDLRDDAAMGTRTIMDYQYKSICRGEHSIFEQIKAQGVDPTKHIFFFNLRSFDRLNVTPKIKKQEEKSGVKYQDAQRAQAEEIMDSSIHGSKDQDDGEDKHMGQKSRLNPLAHTHKEKEKQKENEGTNDDSNSEAKEEATDAKRKFEAAEDKTGQKGQEPESTDTVATAAMHHTPSLVDEVWEGDLKDEANNWIQEELYIHGKVMIVDDRTVVCGSSNLNDRSQLGVHDSELSIVMTDQKVLKSTMDGKEYDAGTHAATLRRYLWREHLGLLPPQVLNAEKDPNAQPPDVPNDPQENDTYEFVADPLSDEVWDMWTSRASKNTEVFRRLFHADPDDHSMSPPFSFSRPSRGPHPWGFLLPC
jgi:phospholipase D1/2